MTAFEQRGRVRWAETDASGLFHYPSALIWAEEAEHALYRTVLPGLKFYGLPRRSVSATYSVPLEAGDDYLVRLWVEKLGSSSLTFDWVVLKGEIVAVEGRHTVINVGPGGKPTPLAAQLRNALKIYSKKSKK